MDPLYGMTDDISIHALHEESDRLRAIGERLLPISIHALHEESDLVTARLDLDLPISIHALHEESDRKTRGTTDRTRNFNPRSP